METSEVEVSRSIKVGSDDIQKNSKDKTTRKKEVCWFCKITYVDKKHIGLGYICKPCTHKMGYFQMW